MREKGGALLFHRMSRPIDITKSTREIPSPMVYVEQSRKQNPGVWIDIEKTVFGGGRTGVGWLAARCKSIGVCEQSHVAQSNAYERGLGKGTRHSALAFTPGQTAIGRRKIYYHIFETPAFAFPPSAGSASGVLGKSAWLQPRVRASRRQVSAKTAWWDGLGQGETVFVTKRPRCCGCVPTAGCPAPLFTADGAETAWP